MSIPWIPHREPVCVCFLVVSPWEIHQPGSRTKFRRFVQANTEHFTGRVWSNRSVLAVEPFIAIAAEPRKEFTWKYTYGYYTTEKICSP